jgi:hypothetical protein
MKTTILKNHSAAICQTDLCCTCIHYPNCSFRKLSTAPILFCEEFRITAPKDELIKTGKTPSDSYRMSRTTKGKAEPALQGLCCNCANRSTCGYIKPPGGVWHCSEYA